MTVLHLQMFALFRSVIGMLAVLALVVQSLSPAMAHDSQSGDGGMWMEICADTGPVLVRLREDGTVAQGEAPAAPHGQCPKCLTCTLCTVDAAAVLRAPEVRVGAGDLRRTHFVTARLCDVLEYAHVRPMTRGPPAATPVKMNAARDGRAMPVTPIQEGGAL